MSLNKLNNDDQFRIDDYLADNYEYTEGENNPDRDVEFNSLPEAKKKERTNELWRVLVRKSKHGAHIIDRVKFLKGKFLVLRFPLITQYYLY